MGILSLLTSTELKTTVEALASRHGAECFRLFDDVATASFFFGAALMLTMTVGIAVSVWVRFDARRYRRDAN